jgi:phosphate:Na+ symporter
VGATETLIRIIGSVALLLWGLRMVQTGISRGFGTEMRSIMQANTGNRFRAFLAGLVVTMMVQSSTATALITSTFARQGLVTLTAAIAIILGADVGTTLVAQLLSLDLSLLPYVLVLVGFVMHKTAGSQRYRQLGRVAIGLSLMLFALRFILLSAEPLRQSVVLQEILTSLAGEPLLAVLVMAVLAWITHSSLATVLLIASLMSSGAVPPLLGVYLVLGANLGGAIPPIIATLSSGIVARRVTIGNAALKTLGIIVVMPFASVVADGLIELGIAPESLAVNVHMAFNMMLALVFLPIVGIVGAQLEKFVQEPESNEAETGPRHLDEGLIETPVLALAAASREVLNMATYVETMLRGVSTAIETTEKAPIKQLRSCEDVIDQFYEEIKFYVTGVTKQEMTNAETLRAAEILLFTTNLEHIGDIAENLLTISEQRISENLVFSEVGLAEIEELHARVVANLNLATGVFMSGEVSVARMLLEEKTSVNKLQYRLTQKHLERLRDGAPETITTSAMHLDTLRDLRRINSHISAVAYPVLEQAGALRKTRLKKAKD